MVNLSDLLREQGRLDQVVAPIPAPSGSRYSDPSAIADVKPM